MKVIQQRVPGSPKRLDEQKGYLILEAMVTLFLVAFSLLGLASMFVRGVEMNRSSYYRSLAMQKAYDMADKIYANSTARGKYAGTFPAGGDPCPPVDCASNTCSTEELVDFDTCSWGNEVSTLLPFGLGTVGDDGNKTFSITVSWDDSKQGSTAVATNPANVTISVRY